MKITKDVIVDLLPLYLAGDVSEDTRRLVEGHLAADPDLARTVAEMKTEAPPKAPPLPNLRAPDHELRALLATRQHLRRRSWIIGLAVALTLFPFSFAYDRHGFHWSWSERPAVAIAMGAVAVVLWTYYWRLRRAGRSAGL